MTPEGAVKEEVKRLLKKRGAYWFMPVQTGFGASTLDILVCYKGVFLAIETKRPGVKSMTPRQNFVARQIEEAGGTAVLVNGSKSLDELASLLDTIDILEAESGEN